MKAVALTALSTLEVCEKDIPQMDDHSILLKVKSVGVCGSDLRIYQNGDARVSLPRVMGHEIAGEIVDKGAFVHHFNVGDRVALGAHMPCGLCKYCQEGLGHHCLQGWTIGYQYDGGFAEYVLLNRTMVENGSVCRFSENTSFEEASLSEPFSCVMSGLRELSIRAGETVAVFGAGAIGCMFVAALRRMGVGKIIVVQRSKARREFAESLGADVCIDPTAEDPVKRILEETNGYGSDFSIITAPSGEVQNQALSCVKKKGHVLFFAGLPKGKKTELDTNQIIYKELKISGVHGASKSDHREAVRWIDNKFVDFSRFITHRFKLNETQNAFIASKEKTGVKSVVLPEWVE